MEGGGKEREKKVKSGGGWLIKVEMDEAKTASYPFPNAPVPLSP